MLFKDCKFYGNKSVLNSWKRRILEKVNLLFQEEGITGVGQVALGRYVEYLLEDTDYNVRDNVFYEPKSKFKFTADMFAQITFEYVLEHRSEFTS